MTRPRRVTPLAAVTRLAAVALLAGAIPGTAACANHAGEREEPAGRDAAGGAAPVEAHASGQQTAGDTVRGVLVAVGAAPSPGVMLRPSAGQPADTATAADTMTAGDAGEPVVLTGPHADALRGLAGLEVMVEVRAAAEPAPGRFRSLEALAFRVRALDGVPAADGVLELDGDAAVLVTDDGRRVRYPHAPAALRALEGRHVWVAAPVGTEPQQWGQVEGR